MNNTNVSKGKLLVKAAKHDAATDAYSTVEGIILGRFKGAEGEFRYMLEELFEAVHELYLESSEKEIDSYEKLDKLMQEKSASVQSANSTDNA